MRRTLLTVMLLAAATLGVPATGQALDIDLASQFTARFDGYAAGAATGRTVADAGDVNGDGIDDVIVGSAHGNAEYNGSGQANVLYGAPDMPILDLDTWTLNKPSRALGFAIGASNAAQHGVGSSVAGAGDVNGDGYDDVIVGAPTTQYQARTSSGATHVIFGGPGLFDRFVPISSNGFTVIGALDNDNSGTSVAGAGDVNGDGYDDIIIGAPNTDNNGRTDAGSAYVLYGSATPSTTVDLATALPITKGFRIDGATAGDHLGHAVAGVGDINGDGYDDVAVGAPDADPYGRSSAGSVYVIYGSKDGQNSPELVDGPIALRGFRIDGAAAGDSTGDSVAGVGDFNGDGYDDVAVGADKAAATAGAASVLFGGQSPSTIDLSTGLTAARGVRYTGVSTDQAGTALSRAGDVNGDGYDDLVIGSPGWNAPASGAASVVYGSAAPAGFSLSTTSPLQGFRVSAAQAGDAAGTSVGGGGDINGDGRPDVIVGSPSAGQNARTTSGSAYVASADFLPAVAYDGHVAGVVGDALDLAPTRLSASPVATLAIAPDLPAGLSFDPATGHITGTPAALGDRDYTVTLTDPRRGVAHASFRLSVVGATGPQGTTGGSGGTGAQGPAGTPGVKGAAGKNGKDAKATCKVTGKKTKPKVTCKVKKSGRRAVLSRHGRIYARGSARHLRAVRTLRPGRYVLKIGRLRLRVRLS